MMSLQFIIAVTLFYSPLLFLVAYIADTLAAPAYYIRRLSIHCRFLSIVPPDIYGQGSAARNGLEFITIYLGPTLVFIGWWWFLCRLWHRQA